MAESTAAVPGSRLAPGGRLPGFAPLGYGYEWWTFPNAGPGRIFGALGIFGQQIYVDGDEEVVIVLNGAWPQPVYDRSRLESYVFFNAVTKALHDRRCEHADASLDINRKSRGLAGSLRDTMRVRRRAPQADRQLPSRYQWPRSATAAA